MKKMLTLKQAGDYIGVSDTTMRRLTNKGLITVYKTEGGHRRYFTEDLDRYLGIKKTTHGRKIILGYCRVSTSGQRDDLERQEEVIKAFCEKQGEPFLILKDIGSGLNYKRKNFRLLIEMVSKEQVSILVVNYKDRLMRFGYEMLEEICKAHDTEIVIMNQTEEVSAEKEMVEDILSIITVFSSRLYGKRSHRNQKIIEENRKMFREGYDVHSENCKVPNEKTE